MDSIYNKVCIITGASSGIGEATAIALAKRKAKIVLAARNEKKLNAIAEQLNNIGVDFLVQPTDVSKKEDCQALIDSTIEKFGAIDILINNAGISMRAIFEEVELDVIEEVMQVNFWGAVYCSKFALPYILKSKGSIVGVSSIAGYRGLPARVGYSSSKFALNGFLEVLRTEMLHKHVNVLTVSPGFTASNIRKTARIKDGSQQGDSPRKEEKMMSAEEVALRMIKAIEKRKRSLILTSQGKLTVLLNKLIPGRMDSIVYNHMAKEEDSPI